MHILELVLIGDFILMAHNILGLMCVFVDNHMNVFIKFSNYRYEINQ